MFSFFFEYFICSLFISTAFPANSIFLSVPNLQSSYHSPACFSSFAHRFLPLHFQRHFHSVPLSLSHFQYAFLRPYRPFMFCLPIWVVISELPLPSHVSVSVSVFRDLIWQRSFLPLLRFSAIANCKLHLSSQSFLLLLHLQPCSLFPMLFFRFQSFASICCIFRVTRESRCFDRFSRYPSVYENGCRFRIDQFPGLFIDDYFTNDQVVQFQLLVHRPALPFPGTAAVRSMDCFFHWTRNKHPQTTQLPTAVKLQVFYFHIIIFKSCYIKEFVHHQYFDNFNYFLSVG